MKSGPLSIAGPCTSRDSGSMYSDPTDELPDGAADMDRRMDLLRSRPPSDIAGHAVVSVTDMAGPGSSLPPTDALVFELDGGRLVIRPSGTEPMLKAYAEVIGPSAEIDSRSSERAGDLAVSRMLDGVCALLGGSSR